jgi:hypothetical protein
MSKRHEEDVYVELPEEAGAGVGKCGKLAFWLYGCRPAAQAWEDDYAGKLEGVGFERGKGSSVVFYHEGRDLSLVVHVDDFTICGEDPDLDWFQALMFGWYEIKVRARLGDGERDDKEVSILGRQVRWTEEGIEFEADPKHRRLVLEAFRMVLSRAVTWKVGGGRRKVLFIDVKKARRRCLC